MKRKPAKYLGVLMHHIGENLHGLTAKSVSHIEVRQDAWCPLLKSPGGVCNCNPVVISGAEIDKKYEPKVTP